MKRSRTITIGGGGVMKALITVLLLVLSLSPCLLIAQEGMILVAGGTFQMGSTTGNSDEIPVHAVTVSSFYLDVKEVTVAQYRAFCTATARSMPSAPSWGWSEDNPIVLVSWNDATAYSQWAGKRLPTEAEWEYAARGGNLSHGYTYSGSNTIGDVAWYNSNSGTRTQAVGTKMPNELGLYDMSGNVYEFCSDWYDAGYYSVSPSVNPKGPSTATYRVMRGGSWVIIELDCRVANRDRYTPASFSSIVGFRCAASEPTSVGRSIGDAVREFSLNQNYPNPFNPSTTIRYGLPHKTTVQLSVFNTLGQQVAVLENGEQDPGYHEVKFDASKLASGVYLYRIQAGTFVQTKRLLLIR
jgi:sulfatase modifying factor 1